VIKESEAVYEPIWITYALVVLALSGLIGSHLGRFREAYTEMTGMMAGMTMGMLNGFLLGYAAAAATLSMFWGNLAGIVLGLLIGVYFGRAGSLMGMLDGGMGGVMGGSMGAMLAVMVAFPREAIYWTALLLGIIYILGMVGLVALIEQSAPGHEAMHRVLPVFTRAIATEAAEEREKARTARASASVKLTDYYLFLAVPQSASAQEISDAYLEKLAAAGEADVERAERALATLTDPRKREIYDHRLKESKAYNSYDERGDCCPPPRKRNAQPMSAGKQFSGQPLRQPIERTIAVGSVPRTSATTQVTAAPLNAGKSNGNVATAVVKTSVKGASVATTLAPPTRKSGTASKNRTAKVQQHAPAQVRRLSATQRREAPISWIGVLAGAVLVVMLTAWWLVGQGNSPITSNTPGNTGKTNSQLEAQAVVAPIAADGRQTLDFVVNGYTASYEPKAIKVKKGIPVHFNVTLNGPNPG
jgi:hypothetical protein